MSDILDFIQTYVATNTENHNFHKTEFKVKSCSEALILNYISIYIKAIYIYIYIYIYGVFIRIPVIYYLPYNSEMLVNK